jgi:ABC-type dipeptide/oligopeptide/nickel transport system ATPase subunit
MLTVTRLSKSYRTRAVLRDVSFTVAEGAVVGLVGQSGSGKSTIAKCILGLERPDAGQITWRGQPLSERSVRRRASRDIQAVFQDPRSSLNPRWTVRRILCEPLDNWLPRETASDRDVRLRRLLDRVSLDGELLDRHPHELSTGQCQRLCIARALAPEPAFLVLDEPLSALDVSVQSRLIALLMDLHESAGIGYLLITHDLAVAGDICDSIVVLSQGEVVESGDTDSVLQRPRHPHTRALLADVMPALPASSWRWMDRPGPGVESACQDPDQITPLAP